ncbi:MAG: 23S rRNA (uracil(1939)-C(5))-methyltransferase RlmD [Acidobacteriota bacterium]
MLARNDLIELEIESAAYEGTTVGRVEGFVVFVPYAVPGDRVRAKVVRRRRKYAEAAIEEVLRPSPDRIEPRCSYFGTCGGCRLQNVAYARQLDEKREQVTDLLERIGHFQEPPVAPTLPAPDPFLYRNKMEFSFGNRRWLTRDEIAAGGTLERDFALGLHVPGRFDRILDLHECHLQAEWTPRLVNRVRRLAVEQGWEPYDTIEHTGFLRNLVIRTGQQTGQNMVVLVTTSSNPDRTGRLARCLQDEFPEVTTLINSVNSTRSPVAVGEEEIVVYGPGYLEEQIRGRVFRITPSAFFQPNTLQAERLFGVVEDFCRLSSDDLLFDLYCGLGSIGLVLASRVRRVVGIESHAEAVRLAVLNAAQNGIGNAVFQAGDALLALKPDFQRRQGRPDVVVLDPPRVGLHPDVVQALLRTKPPRIVYTSCNPATLARDLQLLSERYRLEAVQPVDMFPQTYHIEAVAALSLN